MPEASIHKNGHLRAVKNKIRASRQVDAIHRPASDPPLNEVSAEPFLRGPSVPRTDKSHYSRASLGSDAIHEMNKRIPAKEFSCRSIMRTPKYREVPKSDQKPIAIDFFCGAGGLSLGFHRAGFKVVGAFDIDPIHVATYKKNFPKTRAVVADVAALSGKEARSLLNLGADDPVDMVYGGPPCQGFSLIGKRQSNDPRNQLLPEFGRLIVELFPRYFLIENVAGLMMGTARGVLATTLRLLRSAGYRWVTPIRILDAYDYAIPQRRRRVIILGYRKGEPVPAYPSVSRTKFNVRDAIQDLYHLGRCKSLFRTDRFIGKLGKPNPYSKKLRHSNTKNVSLTGCQLCAHEPEIRKRFKSIVPGNSEPISRFVRLTLTKPAPTLRAGTARDKGGFTAPRPIHPTQARCITVREAARLHSFPDWFEFHGTQWHGFRQVGNSVPPMMAYRLAQSIFRAQSRDVRSHV